MAKGKAIGKEKGKGRHKQYLQPILMVAIYHSNNIHCATDP